MKFIELSGSDGQWFNVNVDLIAWFKRSDEPGRKGSIVGINGGEMHVQQYPDDIELKMK